MSALSHRGKKLCGAVSLKEVEKRARAFLPHSYLFFIAGFFLVSISKWHNNFFYGAVLLPFLLTFKIEQVRVAAHSRIFLLSIAYLFFVFLTLLWGENRELHQFIRYGFRFVYLASFLTLTIVLLVRHPGFLRKIFVCICWAAGVAACISITVFIIKYPIPDGRLWSIGRAYHPTQAGTLYCFAAIVCYFIFLQTAKGLKRYGYLLLGVLMIGTETLTQSRGPALALALSAFFSSLLKRQKRTVFLTVTFVLILAAGLFYNMETVLGLFERGDSDRIEIWRRTLEMSTNALWFGHGVAAESSIVLASGIEKDHPHNIFLASLFYSGVTGTSLLLMLLICAVRGAILYYRESKNNAVLFAMILFGIICGLTDNDKLLCHPKPIWLFFWLPIALISYREVLREGKHNGTKNDCDAGGNAAGQAC